MREVMLGMQVSLDGFVATEKGGLDWAFRDFSPELMAATVEVLETFDTVLMGRHNYEEQAASWMNTEGPIANIMNRVEKVVFSTSLHEPLAWNNSRLAAASPEVEIAQLKRSSGGAVGVAGGARLAQYLSSRGLIDEFRLTIHPTALGQGMPIFVRQANLTVVGSAEFPNGVTVKNLRPKAA